jgi:hypothetical protein
VAAEVPPRELRTALHFDEHWGPTEWGPIPFLPKPDLLVEAMENAWGDLYKYRGLNSTANGNLLVAGVQVRPCSTAMCVPCARANPRPLLLGIGCDRTNTQCHIRQCIFLPCATLAYTQSQVACSPQ